MNNQAASVANYLNALPDIKNARPCRVSIGKTSYFGTRYTSIGHYQAGMQAVTDGSKKDGDEYESDRFYLLMDKLPVSYSRRPKPVYVLDGKEWYLSSYYDQPEANEQHPFGKTFSLQAWDIPGEKIDQHDRKPRLRMQVTVEYLDAADNLKEEQPPMPTVGTAVDVSPTGDVPQAVSA